MKPHYLEINLHIYYIFQRDFEIFSDSLSEERSYKIQLRYTDQSDSSLIEYYDLHDTFKVVR